MKIVKLAILVAILWMCASCAREAKSAASEQKEPQKAYSCVAGQNEQCASDLWYADYQRLKAMRAKYAAPPDINDQMNGMEMRLTQQIPAGYTWDPVKERFIKQPTPAPIPVPTAKK